MNSQPCTWTLNCSPLERSSFGDDNVTEQITMRLYIFCGGDHKSVDRMKKVPASGRSGRSTLVRQQPC